MNAAEDLLERVGNRKFATVLADPPCRFANKTGKMAPEHKRLSRANGSTAGSWIYAVPQVLGLLLMLLIVLPHFKAASTS